MPKVFKKKNFLIQNFLGFRIIRRFVDLICFSRGKLAVYIYKCVHPSQVAQWIKNQPAVLETQETWVQSLSWEDPLKEGMATPVFLPGETHGQRSLAGYSPRDRKESDTTEATGHAHSHILRSRILKYLCNESNT